MNTVLKNRVLAGASLFAMMFGAVSCVDDPGLILTPEAPNADKTIYEIIKNDTTLSNFVEVLDSCDLPGGVSVADSLFNQSRVYTLWAPTNKALTEKIKDSLINRIKVEDARDDVMNTFVKAHIANNLHPAKGTYKNMTEERELILMLNGKKTAFEGSYEIGNGYKFGNNYLCSFNERAWNGIVHRLDSTAKYRYNIWEVMTPVAAPYMFGGDVTDLPMGIDSIANFLYSFNERNFSPGLSTLGPIIDGEQTYLDSVWVNSNIFLNAYNGVGTLDSEDSVYTMYVPTNRLWNEFLEKYERHFNYDIQTTTKPQEYDSAYLDSIKFLYPRINMIKYLSFSNKENDKYIDRDTFMTANVDRGNKRLRIAKSDLEKCLAPGTAQYKSPLSNGNIRVIDKYPYEIFDLWHDTIKIEGEDNVMFSADLSKYDAKSAIITVDQIRKDHPDKSYKLSGSRYRELIPKNGELTAIYTLPNVKSASYQVAIITLPMDLKEKKDSIIQSKDKAALELYKFQQADKNATPPLANFHRNMKDKYELNYERVDTIFLLDKETGDTAVVKFPWCEYYNTYNAKHFSVNIQLMTVPLEDDKDNIDGTLRIDQILLIPVEDPE